MAVVDFTSPMPTPCSIVTTAGNRESRRSPRRTTARPKRHKVGVVVDVGRAGPSRALARAAERHVKPRQPQAGYPPSKGPVDQPRVRRRRKPEHRREADSPRGHRASRPPARRRGRSGPVRGGKEGFVSLDRGPMRHRSRRRPRRPAEVDDDVAAVLPVRELHPRDEVGRGPHAERRRAGGPGSASAFARPGETSSISPASISSAGSRSPWRG